MPRVEKLFIPPAAMKPHIETAAAMDAARTAVVSFKVIGDRRDLRAAQRHREAQAEKQAADAAAEGEPPGRHAVAVGHLYCPDRRGAADERSEQNARHAGRSGFASAEAVILFTAASAADHNAGPDKERQQSEGRHIK